MVTFSYLANTRGQSCRSGSFFFASCEEYCRRVSRLYAKSINSCYLEWSIAGMFAFLTKYRTTLPKSKVNVAITTKASLRLHSPSPGQDDDGEEEVVVV